MIPTGNAQFWMENCPDCNYQLRLREPTNGKCTECGWAFDELSAVFVFRHRKRYLLAAIFFFVPGMLMFSLAWYVVDKPLPYFSLFFLLLALALSYGVFVAIRQLFGGPIVIAFGTHEALVRPMVDGRFKVDWEDSDATERLRTLVERQNEWVVEAKRHEVRINLEEQFAERWKRDD